MRIFQVVCAALLVSAPTLCFASSPGSTSFDDTPQLVSSFKVAKKTEVPGAVLKSGNYSIRVVDHLSDRVVLQIESPTGKTLTTFLGLPNPGFQTGVSNGPIPWSAGPNGEDALRGFAFPGGAAVEFVYPKAEAVSIAKVNTGKVAAVDPASQGMPSGTNGAKLSKTDLQMLNLWLLSTTRVGAPNDSQPAIQAERYRQPSQPVEQAQTEQQTTPAAYRAAPAPQPRANRVRVARQSSAPSDDQIASAHRPQALTALPHTASDLPAILLAGILALLLAATFRLVRVIGYEG